MNKLKSFFSALIIILISVNFIACSNDDNVDSPTTGAGLKGWYISKNDGAKTADFNEINYAIEDNELLYESKYNKYYANRDLFFYDNGMWNDNGWEHGRFRFSIDSQVCIIHIIDETSLVKYYANLFDSKSNTTNELETVYKIYAGPIFGDLDYCGNGKLYTYYQIDNKIVLPSEGDIYTIVNGGLLLEGDDYSNLMEKYDPNQRYGDYNQSDEEKKTNPKDYIVKNEKKLIEINLIDDYGNNEDYVFSYDEQGYLTSMESTYTTNSTYEWKNKYIKEIYSDDSYATFNFKDGLIESEKLDWVEDLIYFYGYNNLGQLNLYGERDEIDGFVSDRTNLTWENNTLTKIIDEDYSRYEDEYDKEVITISYNGKTCKGYFPLINSYIFAGDVSLIWAHPELAGIRTNQLPNTIRTNDGFYDITYEFSYKFDENGYIKSCIVKEIEYDHYNDSYYELNTSTYTFTWE